MTIRAKTVYLMLGSALAIAVAAPEVALAQAQSSGSADSQQIEQIVVTATRREELLQKVPISISVFSQQQLTAHNVVNAEDLATYTPSLSSNNNFGSQNSSYAIRGFVQDLGTAPSVGVYFNDVVEPRAPGNGVPAGDSVAPGEFFDLQNVQVLKGPQGTLFGRNTTGGAVLLVPQKPTDDFGGYVEGSYGNYNMEGIQGVINIPVTDHVRLRLGVNHMTRDGYLHNTSGVGPKDFDDVDYTALRAGLDVDFTPNLENYLLATYNNSDTNGDFQKLVACDPTSTSQAAVIFVTLGGACTQIANQGKNFYDAQQDLTNPYSRLTTWRLINTTTWEASDNLTIKNIASYAQMKDKLHTSLFGTNFRTPDLTVFNPNLVPFAFDFTNVSPTPGGSQANQSTYTEELQFQGNVDEDRLIWQAGFYLEGSEPLAAGGSQSPSLINCPNLAALQCYDVIGYLFDTLLGVTAPIGAVNYTVGRTTYRDYAAYAQATYKLTDEFKLTGGIRYTHDQETNTSTQITYHFGYPGSPFAATPSCTKFYAPANCALGFKENSQAPTWMVDLDYTPSENILAYAKYSRGYRAGAINIAVSEPYNYVRPEKVDTYEAGLKTTFDGVVSGTFDIDGFYNDFSNQQLLQNFNANPCYTGSGPTCTPAPVSPAAATVNAGRSRIYGLELDASIIPYRGLMLTVDYAYLNTRITSIQTFTTPPGSLYIIDGSQVVGDRLALTPTNKVSFNANYVLPLDQAIGKISVGATFTHTDSMISNYADRYVANPAIQRLGTLPATNLLDLNADWDGLMGQPIDLSFFATNVTDQHYYSFTPGIGGATGVETAVLGQPRFYGVRLRYGFGQD